MGRWKIQTTLILRTSNLNLKTIVHRRKERPGKQDLHSNMRTIVEIEEILTNKSSQS